MLQIYGLADDNVMMKKTFALFFMLTGFSLFAQQTLTGAAERLEADLLWDPLSQTGILAKNGQIIQFKTGSGLALLNNSLLVRMDAPLSANGTVTVTEAFIGRARDFFSAAPPEISLRIGAILIDAGHGGKDPGAIATHTINGKKTQIAEKNIALEVSADLYKQLSSAYPDKKILMTRTDDIFLELDERVEKANSAQLKENEAILYVSVHVNSTFDPKARGFEVWYLSPQHRRSLLAGDAADKELVPILNSMLEEEYTRESVLIAKSILDGLAAQIGAQSPNRGLKAEEWFVVRNAKMPSVLIEVGFLTNPEEAALLNDSAYLRKVSTGIYNGLVSFITLFERSKGFTVAQ